VHENKQTKRLVEHDGIKQKGRRGTLSAANRVQKKGELMSPSSVKGESLGEEGRSRRREEVGDVALPILLKSLNAGNLGTAAKDDEETLSINPHTHEHILLHPCVRPCGN